MARLEVTSFRRGDIPFGMELTDAEQWRRTVLDWRRLYDLEPKGLFKAVLDGREVGVAAALTYDRACWIHSVIVRKDVQRSGIGSALVKRCLEFARSRGAATVKLDSIGGCEPFYERLGFVREHESFRFFGEATAYASDADHLEKSDLPEICAFDKRVTGLDRQRALALIYRDAPELAYVIRAQGKLRGYLLGRWGDDRIQIGPCVVYPDRASYAEQLLSAMINDNKGWTFRACVLGLNPKARAVVEKAGLKMVSTATRMYQGATLKESPSVYVMMSAEKG